MSGATVADIRSTIFQKYIIQLAACLEIVVGITLILLPRFAQVTNLIRQRNSHE
jgi:hypothetical protein